MDLTKFESKLASPQPSKEQALYEKVLAAAVAADRRGFFVEKQTVADQDQTLTIEQVELVWQTSKFQRSLADRGIKTTKNPNLSLRQETFLQAYLNPMNLKPPQVLAKQQGIKATELDGWMRDKHFAEAMSAKAEENLRKYIPIADQALGQMVQQGDMKAIQFLNQLTGRFDPNSRGNVDIVALLMAVQDIVLRHVREPETKRAIARELIALAQGNSLGAPRPELEEAAIIEEETTTQSVKD